MLGDIFRGINKLTVSRIPMRRQAKIVKKPDTDWEVTQILYFQAHFVKFMCFS